MTGCERGGRDPAEYRANVGVCLFDRKGRVWLGQRMGQTDAHSWQFPQGGLDAGESAEFGALRELWEETGVTIRHIERLGALDDWLYYDFAPGTAPRKGLHYRGQRQRWFAYRFTGKAKHFDLTCHGQQEFSRWEWDALENAPGRVVPFKRAVYERLATEFAPYARASG